jgi:membrane fusion protein (multidrug efflux system)
MKTKMKTSFKNIALFSLLIIFFGACKDNKQNDLVKLTKEKQVLEEKITKLESEIKSDTSIVKTVDNGLSVVVEKINPHIFEHYVEVHGKLDGEENVQLFPKGMGSVKQVFVKIGSKVQKDQTIATLDAAALEKSYDQLKTQYDLANDMYERQKKLWDQNIGSEMQYLQAKSQKEGLENGLASLEEQLENMKIKSPINGTVEDLPLKVGMSVSPAMPVATIINFSSLKVVAEISETYSTRVKTGDSVTVVFPDLNKSLSAIVSSASNYISPINRSFKIEVRFPGLQTNYKANMIAVLKIVDYKNEKAITVPVSLIQTDSKGNYVYVAESKADKYVAVKKYVEQGFSYNGLIEITSGLSQGDQIITSGYFSLIQGTQVSF